MLIELNRLMNDHAIVLFDCLCETLTLVVGAVLPGEHAELQRQESADGHSFQQGDKVKCLLEVDILRQMQEGHGGWNPKMAEVNTLATG